MEVIEGVLVNRAATAASAKLYLNANLGDVNFVFETNDEIQKIPANKAILAMLSPVFNAMFFGPSKEKGDVKIVDASADIFKDFLHDDVIRLADKYDIIEPINECATQLVNNLPSEKICWAYQFSISVGHVALKEYCEKVISAFTLDIFKSKTFHQCKEIVLHHILEMNTLGCSEIDVFDACLSWAQHHCKENGIDANRVENLKAALGKTFDLIRFGAMKVDEFTAHTLIYKEMFTSDELSDLLYATTQSSYSSTKFMKEPRLEPVFAWHDNQTLICKLDNTLSGNSLWVLENVGFGYGCQPNCVGNCYFSTNFPCLWGTVFFHRLLKHETGSSTPPLLVIDIKIIEHSDQSFESSVEKKTLCTTRKTYAAANDSKIQFSRPILINPRKMYEQRILLFPIRCY